MCVYIHVRTHTCNEHQADQVLVMVVVAAVVWWWWQRWYGGGGGHGGGHGGGCGMVVVVAVVEVAWLLATVCGIVLQATKPKYKCYIVHE